MMDVKGENPVADFDKWEKLEPKVLFSVLDLFQGEHGPVLRELITWGDDEEPLEKMKKLIEEWEAARNKYARARLVAERAFDDAVKALSPEDLERYKAAEKAQADAGAELDKAQADLDKAKASGQGVDEATTKFKEAVSKYLDAHHRHEAAKKSALINTTPEAKEAYDQADKAADEAKKEYEKAKAAAKAPLKGIL